MKNFLILLVNNWLVNLSDFFFVNDRLVMLMNDWLMVLMNNILMMFMKYILVMLMYHITMMLHYNWLISVNLYFGCHLMFLDEELGCMSFDNWPLLVPYNDGCLGYRFLDYGCICGLYKLSRCLILLENHVLVRVAKCVSIASIASHDI